MTQLLWYRRPNWRPCTRVGARTHVMLVPTFQTMLSDYVAALGTTSSCVGHRVGGPRSVRASAVAWFLRCASPYHTDFSCGRATCVAAIGCPPGSFKVLGTYPRGRLSWGMSTGAALLARLCAPSRTCWRRATQQLATTQVVCRGGLLW